MGFRDYPALPQAELNELKQTIFNLFPQYWANPIEFEATWSTCTEAIGQLCKRLHSNTWPWLWSPRLATCIQNSVMLNQLTSTIHLHLHVVWWVFEYINLLDKKHKFVRQKHIINLKLQLHKCWSEPPIYHKQYSLCLGGWNAVHVVCMFICL